METTVHLTFCTIMIKNGFRFNIPLNEFIAKQTGNRLLNWHHPPPTNIMNDCQVI